MLIWCALLIPVVAAFILWKFYHRQMLIGEFLAPFGVSIALIAIAQIIIQTAQTSDVEYWGGIVTHAAYFERWNEQVPCTHTEYCERCSTDSKGNTTCSSYACGTEHMYDVDNHPPRWVAYDTNRLAYPISAGHFHDLTQRFGNRKFVDLNRDYHTIDGDKYVTKWGGSPENAEVTTSHHTYENRVQASRSVFNYPEVTEEDIARYGLYEYPPIHTAYKQNPVLGHTGTNHQKGLRKLKLLNGYLGRKHQVHVYVLVFRGQSRRAAKMQEAYWVGANKNEFVIAVGLDESNRVQWAETISWTPSENLKVDTRYFVEQMGTFDLEALVDWLKPQIETNWQRREFKEFDYLRVEPPLWAVLLVFFLTLLTNVGLSSYLVMNQYKDP